MQHQNKNSNHEWQRMFFALSPESSIQQQLHALARNALPHATRSRVTTSDNLHMTLVFLGSIDVEAHACLERAADKIKLPAFDLVLDCLEYSRRRGMLWIVSTRAPAALYDLVHALRAAQSACGLAPEARSFKPHVTLVRHLRQHITTKRIMPITLRARQFVLLRSVGVIGGVRYEVVRKWNLES